MVFYWGPSETSMFFGCLLALTLASASISHLLDVEEALEVLPGFRDSLEGLAWQIEQEALSQIGHADQWTQPIIDVPKTVTCVDVVTTTALFCGESQLDDVIVATATATPVPQECTTLEVDTLGRWWLEDDESSNTSALQAVQSNSVASSRQFRVPKICTDEHINGLLGKRPSCDAYFETFNYLTMWHPKLNVCHLRNLLSLFKRSTRDVQVQMLCKIFQLDYNLNRHDQRALNECLYKTIRGCKLMTAQMDPYKCELGRETLSMAIHPPLLPRHVSNVAQPNHAIYSNTLNHNSMDWSSNGNLSVGSHSSSAPKDTLHLGLDPMELNSGAFVNIPGHYVSSLPATEIVSADLQPRPMKRKRPISNHAANKRLKTGQQTMNSTFVHSKY